MYSMLDIKSVVDIIHLDLYSTLLFLILFKWKAQVKLLGQDAPFRKLRLLYFKNKI